MTLEPATRLGVFEILEPLGSGGMGEVYRARDTSLDRDVAIKVLPGSVVADRDRVARFEREAKVLAALNHPNIAAIYGLEKAGGVIALVMELAPGPTLADRLAEGPLPLEEAIAVARQIADAMVEAHDKGIVHRDLKPQNVKTEPGSRVKVLDFGLAKALEPADRASSAGSLSASPTLTQRATMQGVILGTAAYMAPEQAKGQPVDRRADLWAFGVVLYEMLTGRQPFAADTVTETLSAVLTRDVDLDALPAATPNPVRRLLRRCLERDPERRLRDIGDARLELDEAVDPETPPPATPPEAAPRANALLLASGWVLAVAALALAGWAWSVRREPTAPRLLGHFSIDLPESAPLLSQEVPGLASGPLAISRDGLHIVYVAADAGGSRLALRSLADPTPRDLPGTEGARFPFFSPDGQWVGFFANGKLRKAPLAGGTPTALADAPDAAGGTWTEDGEIVFAPSCCATLRAVSERGGEVREITALDRARGDDAHRWPQLVPGRRQVLFQVYAWSRETSEVELLDLDSGERRLIERDVAYARFAPATGPAGVGSLLFVRDGSLLTRPFDPERPAPAAPTTLIENVRDGQFDVSPSGVLVYVPGRSSALRHSLVWVDRRGEVEAINGLVRGYEDLHLSPDGRTVALTVEEGEWPSPAHVWLASVERGTLDRLTFEGFSRDPVWDPDGESVVFGSKRGEGDFGIYRQRVDGGPAELLWASPTPIWPDPQSFTPDGRTLVFTTTGEHTGDDIWTLTLDGEVSASPWLATPTSEWGGRLSPDGRYLAYNSMDESGLEQVFVQTFPEPGGKRLVSPGGGINPIWSRDGAELFFRRDDRILKVDVDTGGSGFALSQPEALFSGPFFRSGRDFDAAPDGSRFVMMRSDEARTTQRLRVVLDWQALRGSERTSPGR